MPKNYYVNEGNRIGGQEPQALGVEQVKITASADVTKGQILEVSGSFTVAPAGADSTKYVGVASNSALNGEPVVVETEGFVKLDANGAINAGEEVVSAGLGAVKTIGASSGRAVGVAVSDASGNIVYVKLR